MRLSKIIVEVDNFKYDLETEFGFHLVSSDNNVLGGEYRDFESITYPERSGKKIYAHTTKEAYTTKIVLVAFGERFDVQQRIDRFHKLFHAGTKAKKCLVKNMEKAYSFEGYDRGIEFSEFHIQDQDDVIVLEWNVLNDSGETTLLNADDVDYPK